MTKKKIIILCCTIVLIFLITFTARFVNVINIVPIRIIVLALLNLLLGIIAFIALKLSGMKLEISFKNKMQYLVGIVIAFSLSIVIAVIPALCGFSFVGNHMDFSCFYLIYNFYSIYSLLAQ